MQVLANTQGLCGLVALFVNEFDGKFSDSLLLLQALHDARLEGTITRVWVMNHSSRTRACHEHRSESLRFRALVALRLERCWI